MNSRTQLIAVRPIPTPDGVFLAGYSLLGLATLHFPGGETLPELPPTSSPEVNYWQKRTTRAILQVLAGKAPGALPPFDLAAHTTFQRKVWDVLLQIPLGHTLSYGEVAERAGSLGGARAAGQACGQNPIPLLIPCHRVLAAHQQIGGFSGGLSWKIELLRREKVLL